MFSTWDFLAVMFLVLLILLFFSDVFFRGLVLFPHNMTKWYPWAHYAGTLPQDPNAKYTYSDAFIIYYPYYKFLVESLRQGEVALWNPYILCGAPAAYLIPPIQFLPFLTGSLLYGMTVSAILHVFFAGLFMYMYLRYIRLGVPASVLAAAGYMLSSFDLSWISLAQHYVNMTWMPLILLSVELILTRKKFGYAFLLIFALAMEMYDGYPQFVVHICYLTAAYTALRFAMLGKGEEMVRLAKTAGLLMFSVVAAGLLYLAQAASYYLHLQHSDRLARPFGFFAVARYPLSDLLVMFSYNIFGRPQSPEFWAKGYNFGLAEVYIGPVLLLLIIIAVMHRKGTRTFFWVAVFCISLVVIMSNTVFGFLFLHLPGFALSRARPTEIVTFSALVLAGMGLDRLLAEDVEHARSRARLFAWLAGISFAVCLCLMLGLWRPDWLLGILGPAIPGPDANARLIVALKSLLYSMSLFSVGLFTLSLYLGGRLGKTVLVVAVFALLLIDLSCVNRGLIYAEDPRSLFVETEGIKFLKQDKDLFRVFGYKDDALPPDTGWAFGIQDARGYLSIMPGDYKTYVENIEQDIMTAEDRKVGDLKNPASLELPALDLMNVKYLLAAPGTEVKSPKWDLVYDGDMRVYRNKTFLPRSFFVTNAPVVMDRVDILKRIKQPGFDPRSEALIEEDAGLKPSKPDGGPDSVKVVSYQPKEVVIDASNSGIGLLVLLDSYYPGWKSYVDGSERKVLRAYGNFRAVALEKGRHRIRFVFDPTDLKKYMAVSALTAVSLVVLACVYAGFKVAKSRKNVA